jgi:hypothetical protein
LEPIAEQHLAIILGAISKAWSEVANQASSLLKTGDEAEVNVCIKARLNDFCYSAPLWKDIVAGVALGAESVSFDGRRLEPRPDISLLLRFRNRNFPLVVECKIIDHPNRKTAKLYGEKGIARFVAGDYAWATREAIMLGYVRDGSTIENRLSPYLGGFAELKSDPYRTEQLPHDFDAVHPTAQISVHERSFTYFNGNAPGPIALWHLWL